MHGARLAPRENSYYLWIGRPRLPWGLQQGKAHQEGQGPRTQAHAGMWGSREDHLTPGKTRDSWEPGAPQEALEPVSSALSASARGNGRPLKLTSAQEALSGGSSQDQCGLPGLTAPRLPGWLPGSPRVSARVWPPAGSCLHRQHLRRPGPRTYLPP